MQKFAGFEAPNYTQTPNSFFDEIMMKDETITLNEVKLLLFIIRQTFGWHQDGYCLMFSLTDIQTHLNMSRDTANRAISSCLEKGYLERFKVSAQKFKYRLNMANKKTWDHVSNWKERVEPVRKSNQFENQTSPKIKPVRKSNRNRSDNQTSSNAETVDTTESKQRLKKGKEINNNNLTYTTENFPFYNWLESQQT